VQSAAEVVMPSETAETGFEDPQLFTWRGSLWCCARMKASAKDGEATHILARLDDDGPGPIRLTHQRLLRAQRRHQQHWMPRVIPVPGEAWAEQLQFISGCDPTQVIGENGHPILESIPAVAAERFDGSTPAIGFNLRLSQGTADGSLALIHEAERCEGEQYDWHRWVWFDEAGVLREASPPFFFRQRRLERAAGLALHPDGKHLLISYGVAENEAWLAMVDTADIRSTLEDADHISPGRGR
jgi:hypothetical protein